MQLVKPGALASSFVVNENSNLNVSSEVEVVAFDKKTHKVTMQFRCLAFQLENLNQIQYGVPINVKEEMA